MIHIMLGMINSFHSFHSRIAFYVDEQFLQDLTTNNRIDVKERLIFERLIF